MKKILQLFTLADVGLIFILLLISIGLFWQMKSNLQNKKIEIHHHNELVGVYSLEDSQLIELEAGIQIQIAAGKVRIKENNCKHQYCVQQGWSDQLPIICVPNEIAINVISKKEEMLITR